MLTHIMDIMGDLDILGIAVAEYNHVPKVKTYGYRTLPAPAYAPEPAPEPAYVYQEEPIVVPEPEPVVRSAPVRSAPAPFVPYQPEPEPAPAAVVKSAPLPVPAPVPVHPVFHQERAAYAAFMPVPAVPEDHFSAVNYMAGPTLPPALAPAPPVQPISRAAEIVPVFNNEIPQESLRSAAPEPAPEPAAAPVVVEVYANDIDVIDPAVPVEEAYDYPDPAYAAPVQAPAPAQGAVSSQYHAQDEFGNVIYGYSNPQSAKSEQRDAYGNVMGSYSYDDGTGYPKHVAYVADDFGFRILKANNFPVGPAV